MNQMAIINLFFSPVFSLWVGHRKDLVEFSLTLQFFYTYCVVIIGNILLTKGILAIVRGVLGTSISIASARYTVVAILAAVLIPDMFRIAKYACNRIRDLATKFSAKQ